MDKEYKYIYFIIIYLLISSCTQKTDNRTFELEADKEISMLSDSTFFGSLIEIVNHDEMIYMTDNSPRLIKVDQDFMQTRTLKSGGRGPKEFNWISDISYYQDSLYLYDHSLGKMLVYNEELSFAREFTLEAAGNIYSFSANNNHIYVSTPFGENPITMFDKNGKVLKTFGVQSADTASFNVYRNGRQLLISKDKLIAISESDPIVRIYDLRGELINSIEIDHPLISDRVSYIKDTYKKPSPQGGLSITLLFRDAVINNEKLYLLAHTHTEEITDKYTLILSYEIQDGEKLNFSETFKLYKKDRIDRLYGTALTVLDNRIILFDDALFTFSNENIQ